MEQIEFVRSPIHLVSFVGIVSKVSGIFCSQLKIKQSILKKSLRERRIRRFAVFIHPFPAKEATVQPFQQGKKA
ncbi:hypothetical protein, partial [uncultured Fibrobacter sp.]|uniref:hypothetical protein n=1 Tax=uncultured Fibrobacter sp. TaxID=261512 RepID=UPI002804FD9C